MRIDRFLSAAFLFAAASVCALAAEPAKAVPPVATGAMAGLMQVALALVFVIAAIFVTAWLMRRFTPGQFGSQAPLRMVGGVMVGNRERVVIVEVDDTWLVLGVTAAGISNLHSLPRPEGAVATPAASHVFAEKLATILKARKAPNPTQDTA
ncbi:flagellar biosynthetic protein FliO [Chitinimonas arctica]|uniref:Flagellar protein n=1 Tax=Chitinimonas arctica TaxID=2594795 RepID=A0A516SKJ3_9NEIS|nr:flagellar biosynthetic protein FliO [Chitinimonas arctica]QDQ28675.1 flagellar biosynthetic protein FliO [Chitinimonas arctica]